MSLISDVLGVRIEGEPPVVVNNLRQDLQQDERLTVNVIDIGKVSLELHGGELLVGFENSPIKIHLATNILTFSKDKMQAGTLSEPKKYLVSSQDDRRPLDKAPFWAEDPHGDLKNMQGSILIPEENKDGKVAFPKLKSEYFAINL